MAALKRRQYCLGEMTVGSLPAPPPRITEDLTHVSSCLSQVYCRQQHAELSGRNDGDYVEEREKQEMPVPALQHWSA